MINNLLFINNKKYNFFVHNLCCLYIIFFFCCYPHIKFKITLHRQTSTFWILFGFLAFIDKHCRTKFEAVFRLCFFLKSNYYIDFLAFIDKHCRTKFVAVFCLYFFLLFNVLALSTNTAGRSSKQCFVFFFFFFFFFFYFFYYSNKPKKI